MHHQNAVAAISSSDLNYREPQFKRKPDELKGYLENLDRSVAMELSIRIKDSNAKRDQTPNNSLPRLLNSECYSD